MTAAVAVLYGTWGDGMPPCCTADTNVCLALLAQGEGRYERDTRSLQ